MKKNPIRAIIFLTFLNLFLIFTVCGCSNKDELKNESREQHSDDEHKDHGHENEVVLTEAQISLMGIELTKIEQQNINGYIKVNGEIMMNQDNESKVGSIIPGRVKKIYVKEGTFVRAGQTLAVIENPDLINVQVEYINAKNEYEFAKQEYDRQKKLSNDNIGSKKNLAEIETNYKRTLANFKSLEEKLTSYKISKNRFDNIYTDTVADLQRNFAVTAPISGNVVSRMISIGQYVEPSMDMFHIVNTSSVYVDLSIFEKDLPYVQVGQTVEIEIGSNTDNKHQGKISFISNIFDDKNRTVKVRVAIDNRSRKLYPFMFVTAKIYVNESSVPSIPVSSVESEGESKYIFIKRNEKKDMEIHDKNTGESEEGIVFKKYQINTGMSDDRFTEIFLLNGLKPGDEVVSKGTFYLRSELKKEDLGGHEH